MFRAAQDTTRYIEFLEWKSADPTADPRLDARLRSCLASLAEFGTAHTELWIEP